MGACCGTKETKQKEEMNKINNNTKVTQEQENKHDYEKREILGQGAFSTVYKAFEKSSGKTLAIKTVKLQGDKEQVNRTILALKSEIKLLKGLKGHKNIINYQFMQVSPDNQHVDIALEYIAQGSLRKVLDLVRLDEPIIRQYTKQILEGVKYLHEKNVLHRDLKAANILVDHDGTIKLTDFGTSKIVDPDEQNTIMQNKSIKGTPYWMAPEVCSQKGATFASDIWSVAGVVIEMIGGYPPYADKFGKERQASEIIKEIAEGKKPNYPKDTSSLAKRFLDKIYVPVQIRPTAAELLNDSFVNLQIITTTNQQKRPSRGSKSQINFEDMRITSKSSEQLILKKIQEDEERKKKSELAVKELEAALLKQQKN